MSGVYELLDLIARWVHVIAAIMWAGNSLLFNWLDRNLRPRNEQGVYGDIWLLHSGGFYLVEKNQGERQANGALSLPRPLHWFKWQAYTTWLSGAALLIVVYYAGGRALLVDSSRAALSPATGVLVAAGTIVAGWISYELLWRTIGSRAPRVAGAASLLLLVVAIQWLLSQLSGRAAFVHVGALLGTIMAGNVAMVIMPSQRELVAALAEGRAPSQEIADRAKTRSIHNNYLTFPVILLMVSAHFPSLYSQASSGLALMLLIGVGAAVRHILNVRFIFSGWRLALAATIGIGIVLLAFLYRIGMPASEPRGLADRGSSAPQLQDSVTFADARRVIDRRCTTCHSTTPSDVSLGVMPGGIAFDTPDQIHALTDRIRERAITTRTMPPGNKTRMTDAERQILQWWLNRR